jgi:uncharacterized protein YceK
MRNVTIKLLFMLVLSGMSLVVHADTSKQKLNKA